MLWFLCPLITDIMNIHDNQSFLLFSITKKEIEVSIIMNNTDRDQHFAGIFNVLGEEIPGKLIYNAEKGSTLISLVKILSDTIRDKAYGTIDIITGTLNTGEKITLFHNRCAKNTTYAFHTQHLAFFAEYAIWSRKDASSSKFNKLVCILENALNWSGKLKFHSVIESIMSEEKPNQVEKFHIPYDQIREFLPQEASYKETCYFIRQALEFYCDYHKNN